LNLFLVGWSDGGAVDPALADTALRRLVERLPFFPHRPVDVWAAPSGSAAAAMITHSPEQTGGVRYWTAGADWLSLFSGRPILWTGEREADGRGPIDPAAHPRDADELDGRFVHVRVDGDRLDVVTDSVGAYPVYETEVEGVRWVSNNPELLRDLRGSRELDPSALAGVLGGGWSLEGHPLWAGVRRIGADRLRAERVAPLIGAGLDPERAAALLVAATRALADWPGRPNVVPITGGRDSRLVLAAALAGGVDVGTVTGGGERSPDVRVGRRLAEAAGVPHSLIPPDPHGGVWDDWRRAAEVLGLSEAGTATLADAAGFPLGPREGPLPLWHSGQGGEIGRTYYGLGEGLDRAGLADLMLRRFLGRRPGRADVLSEEGRTLVRDLIAGWVGDQLAAGIAAADVPDMFYLQRRMGTWAGPTHGAVEHVRDTTSPLWSARLLPDLLGAPARERAQQAFHERVLERLAPRLAEIPYEYRDSRGARLRRRTRQLLAEARRRTLPAAGSDPFGPILGEIREAVLSQPDHAAWGVLDRPRVEALLSSQAGALDTMSRYYAWRLATVFGLR
jgi:hypothetical protein